jgi:tetratricopeptide (TPR) repeat protein
MPRLAALLLMFFVTAAIGQSAALSSHEDALRAVTAADADRRAEGITWIASHGTQQDAPVLTERLTDESPYVRNVAEQGLWVLWGRSGDDAVDALLARGMQEMRERQLDASIATFSEVIRQKPEFAEGWNKRATALFLAGELKRSLADCDEVIKRNPLHFGVLSGYGQIYYQLEQYERAIEYWKRALAVNPNLGGVEAGIEAAEQMIEQKRKRST